ncbi:hypothetical protein ALC60_08841 [Trachymyrmex zeteki]|uniref:Uncharacterized protein n=1 Tax=Mycetomoellerius zeteki TaxID=64791 RepID=A0A151WWN3_9HYME|nr:hypothetical protein ALC60_08841 [Trachymyrmex zeteki]
MPIKRTEENNRDTRHDDSASRLESRKRHSHPFRARCPCPSITLLSRRQTRYPCWTPRTDLMPGLHLRTKRAIYAQRKENVSFAPGKKKHPAVSLKITTRSIRRIRVWCSKGSGWEPIFPRGWNKVEGEVEEGVVVSSVSACGRWGGCGQSRGRMGWDTDGTNRTIPSIVVSIYAGVSTEALKPRSSNLPVRLKLLSSYPRPSTRAGVFWTLVDRSLLAVEFQTLGPVTELAGQIQAMHNNRSPRKLWGRMVSGRIKQGGST